MTTPKLIFKKWVVKWLWVCKTMKYWWTMKKEKLILKGNWWTLDHEETYITYRRLCVSQAEFKIQNLFWLNLQFITQNFNQRRWVFIRLKLKGWITDTTGALRFPLLAHAISIRKWEKLYMVFSLLMFLLCTHTCKLWSVTGKKGSLLLINTLLSIMPARKVSLWILFIY